MLSDEVQRSKLDLARFLNTELWAAAGDLGICGIGDEATMSVSCLIVEVCCHCRIRLSCTIC
jgi:hypothetical protein